MSGIAQQIINDPDSYSIDMLTTGVKNGTVPAYIGIPLIQEKTMALKQSQAMQAGMQQQGQPPIADQVLTDAAQTAGLEALPTGLPTEGFAPGGIIAFADGGEADDDEEDDDEIGMGEDEKQLFNILRSRLADVDEYEEMAGIGALPAGQTAVRTTKHEVSSKVGNEPTRTVSEGTKEITKANRNYNVGNLRPTNFSYPGQIGKDKGGFAIFDTPESGIAALTHDINVKVNRGLDTPAKFINVYAPPKSAGGDNPDNITSAYINNVSKALGIGPNDKIPKTREALDTLRAAIIKQEGMHYAQGGKVPGFADGVYVDPMGNPVYGSEPDYSGFKPGEAISNWMSGMGLASNEELLRRQEEKKKKEAEKKAASNIKAGVINPDEEALAAEKAARYKPPVEAKPEEPALVNPMGDYIGEYAAYLKDRKGQMAKDKETNKYLALLQAGLGMMGGTSRYAGANIGQGASQGVAAYMAGRKQESADDRALQQGMLGLSRASLYEKMHLEDIKRKALADNNMKLYREADLAIKQQNAKTNALKAGILGTAKQREFNMKAEKSWQDSPDYAALIKDLAAQKKDWKNDTKLREQYERGRTKYIRGYLEENQGGPGIIDAEDA